MSLLAIVAAVVLLMVGVAWFRRSPPAPAPAGAERGPDAANALLRGFDLRPRETAFFGAWREGELDGQRVAFQARGSLSAYIGRFDPDEEQITEVYLAQVPAGSRDPDRARDLAPHVDPGLAGLARRFRLNAGLPREHALRTRELGAELLGLSEAVVEVMIYETGGVQLEIDPLRSSTSTLRSDLCQAARMVAALERRGANA